MSITIKSDLFIELEKNGEGDLVVKDVWGFIGNWATRRECICLDGMQHPEDGDLLDLILAGKFGQVVKEKYEAAVEQEKVDALLWEED